MDYQKMAEELLENHAQQLKVPASRQMSQLLKGELFVLNYLSIHNRTAYPKELSREMVVSTARIAALLNAMEGKGWIRRSGDAADSRQTIVTLTDAGRTEIETKRREIIGSVVEMLEALGPDDAQEFLRIERRIVEICFREH